MAHEQQQEDTDFERLEVQGIIGFNGSFQGSFNVHPDKQHLVYSIGSTLVIEEIQSSKQCFLHGHHSDIACITISKSGRFIASGQITHMGFKADIIVWDFESRQEYARFVLHKVKIQGLAFSPNEKFLASLGGQDDGSVVIWSLAKKEAICGSPAQSKSAGNTRCLAYAHNSDYLFVTAGENNIRVWELDVENRKIRPTEVGTGQTKRIITCLALTSDDRTLFCGTTTGDVLGINMESRLFQSIGPEKEKFSLGVTALALLETGDFLIGAGNGMVQIMRASEQTTQHRTVRRQQQKLDSGVSSLSLRGKGHEFYASTEKSQIYKFNLADFSHTLVNTCHSSAINDIAFPFGTSDLFATCSYEDIRVWHTPTQKELLRITVPNMTCYAIDFLRDGSGIVSGWDDSKIRVFFPETGRLMYTINEAHKKGVTAITATSDCGRIISGGGEGQVRVWRVQERVAKSGQKTFVTELEEAMKEHANAVSCIRVSKDNTQCVSASADGSCIVWDLKTFHRKQIMFSKTLFRCVCFEPEECQVITSGTDRKISYWELYDGTLVRELDGSRSGSVNGMDISLDGQYFVTAGDDKIVKVWRYAQGDVTHVGLGHSSPIMRAKICPNNRLIVTVSDDGGIFVWKFPF
uniref:Cilia- and flagella-associated protein 52 n=3 Tax=Macrostomum lignano TaxID=282301 RepID=A0A1I8H039_9PLAT